MRKNNFADMTVVEQLIAIRDDVCEYACKYRESVKRSEGDEVLWKISVQRYCHDCPLTKLHYQKEKRHGS